MVSRLHILQVLSISTEYVDVVDNQYARHIRIMDLGNSRPLACSL
jgi:hypothetical protein